MAFRAEIIVTKLDVNQKNSTRESNSFFLMGFVLHLHQSAIDGGHVCIRVGGIGNSSIRGVDL